MFIFTAPAHRKKEGKKFSLPSLALISSQLFVLSPSAYRRSNARPLCVSAAWITERSINFS